MRGAGLAVAVMAAGHATPVDPVTFLASPSAEPARARRSPCSRRRRRRARPVRARADGFVALAGAQPLDGRITAPRRRAFDRLAARAGAIRLPRAPTPGVDLARHDAPAPRSCASSPMTPASATCSRRARAPAAHDPRASRRPLETARVVAGSPTSSSSRAQRVGDRRARHVARGATLAHVHAISRIEINHAHPGEARRLLEPDEPQDKNLCPPDTWIDASLHGQVGVLEAVLDTMVGPLCEQHPDLGRFDTDTASLVGVLVEPRRRRAVFRVPGGARAFEPGRGERIEINYIVVAGRTTPVRPLRRPSPPARSPTISSCARPCTSARDGPRSCARRPATGGWSARPRSRSLRRRHRRRPDIRTRSVNDRCNLPRVRAKHRGQYANPDLRCNLRRARRVR